RSEHGVLLWNGFAFQKQPRKSRMTRGTRKRLQDRFGVASEPERSGTLRLVVKRYMTNFDVFEGGNSDLGTDGNSSFSMVKLHLVRMKCNVVTGRPGARWRGRGRPHLPRFFVTNVDPESVDVARRVWCSARDGAALPANPARTRVRDQRREPSVGEQSDSRCRRTALRLPDGKVIGRSWCRFHPIEF